MSTNNIKEEEFKEKLAVYKNRILQLGLNNQEYLRANKNQATQYIKNLIKLNIDTTTITSLNIFSNQDDLLTLTIYLFKIIAQNHMLNGGLITFRELQYHFSDYNIMISKQELIDIVINHFNKWDTGVSLLYLGDKQHPIIRCFPMDISKDHEIVLNILKEKSDRKQEAFISVKELREMKDWSPERCTSVLMDMVHIGILWIDEGNNEISEKTYWDYSSIYN